ncbi:MAG: phosphoribosyltransferase [Ferruginibacter sp.]|nr:phosphoribosyltransferase [Ferruginibacter sp.]
MAEKKYILSKEVAEKKLRRMALQVAEQNYEEPQLILIGIKENGIIIARKISAFLQEVYQGEIIVVELSMNKRKPRDITLHPLIDFNGKAILLIDDVANSGSTMLYALKPLLETYPKKIQTLALVERTHKSFPIDVDYVGLSISTTLDEHIYVEVEGGEVGGAWMEEATTAALPG